MSKQYKYEFPDSHIWKTGGEDGSHRVFVPNVLSEAFEGFVKSEKIKIKPCAFYNYLKSRRATKEEKLLNEGTDYVISLNDVNVIKKFMKKAYKGIKINE
jgi:hypothetical protein